MTLANTCSWSAMVSRDRLLYRPTLFDSHPAVPSAVITGGGAVIVTRVSLRCHRGTVGACRRGRRTPCRPRQSAHGGWLGGCGDECVGHEILTPAAHLVAVR